MSATNNRQSHYRRGLIPADQLFAHPGEQDVVDPGPPLTPDEQFRERVAATRADPKRKD